MQWNIFKIIQLCCWTSSIVIIILSLTDHHVFKEPENVLELLGLLSAATLALNEVYERWLEKFSAANVLAVGYFKNCIEPVMESQYDQLEKNNIPVKTLFIFLPESIADVQSSGIHKEITDAKLLRKRQTLQVLMRNRNTMDMDEITNTQTQKNYFFDVPNTLSSLEALIDYKLAKKANSSNASQKQKLEKKYLLMFKEETERMIKERKMSNDVKLIDSLNLLP